MKEDLDSVRRDNKEMLEQALARGAESNAASESLTAELQDNVEKLERERDQLSAKLVDLESELERNKHLESEHQSHLEQLREDVQAEEQRHVQEK